MQVLINALKDLLTSLLACIGGYFYGKTTTQNDYLESENKKLKAAAGLPFNGNYTPQSAMQRMSETPPKPDNH